MVRDADLSNACADAGRTVPLAEPTNRWWRALQWVGVVYALFAIWLDIDWSLTQARVTSHGDYGVVLVAPAAMPMGSARLANTRPGGPAALAGLKDGDQVVLADRWQLARTPPPGEVIALRKAAKTVKLTAVPSAESLLSGDRIVGLFAILVNLPAAFLGLFILLRSGGRPAPVMLGIGLGAYGLAILYLLPPSLSWPLTEPVLVTLTQSEPVIQTGAFLYLGIRFLEAATGLRRVWLSAIPIVWAALFLPGVCALVLGYAGLINGSEPYRTLNLVQIWSRFVFDTLSCILFVLAWAQSAGNERKRLTVLTIALGCMSIFQIAIDLGSILYPEDWTQFASQWWFYVGEVLAGVVAPVLFAYAVLRDRILDLGFALNRTLVYSLVSAILLGAFGLIEWGVDHFLKIEGREKNALIDAAIALGVFLTFHRVRDFAERAVEALFFRAWQEKEARLRRFVAEAAYITDRDALLRGLAGALSRFADGVETAIYFAGEQTGFERASGGVAGVADELGENDPALVTLRAERKPIEPHASGSSLQASLCAPMTYGSDVRGFVLFGSKPDGADFRPDEIELIGWATVQVGLDLHALRIEQFEHITAALRQEITVLRSLVPRPV